MGMANPVPKTLSAEKFVVVDAEGNERAELSANSKSAALQFLNPNQSRSIVIATGSQGNGVYLSDGNGKIRTGMLVGDDGVATISTMNGDSETFALKDSRDGAALTFRDSGGHARIVMGYTPKGASINVMDGNETLRADVAEQGVVTFDKGGLLEWASFGEKMSPADRKKVMDLINSGMKP